MTQEHNESNEARHRPDNERDPYHDPSGAGAAAMASSRRHRGMPVFDWIDGLLIVGGSLLLVLAMQGLVALVPSLKDNLAGPTRAFATAFAFGPILIRRAKFAHTLNREGEIRDGLLFRLMSVIGLLLTPVAAFSIVVFASNLVGQLGDNRELATDEAARAAWIDDYLDGEPADTAALDELVYAELEFQETGRNDLSAAGMQRRQQWLDQRRRQSAERLWEDEVQNRADLAEWHDQQEEKYLRIGVFGIVALAAAVAMMRARYKPPEGQRI